LKTKEVAVMGIFSALYAVAILLFKVPSPTGGYTHIGDLMVFIPALLFGWRVGGLVGIIGALVADLYVGYPRFYVSIIAHGLEGLIPGFVGGVLMAGTYFIVNIFLKGIMLALISLSRDLFVQAGISIVVSIPIVKVIKKYLPNIGED